MLSEKRGSAPSQAWWPAYEEMVGWWFVEGFSGGGGFGER